MCYDSNNHYQMATQLLIKVPKIHSYVALIDFAHSFYKSHTYTLMHTNTHTYTHSYIPIVITRIEDVRGPSPAPVLHETSIM